MIEAVRNVSRRAWRDGRLTAGERALPEEAAVAFTYNGTSYAVMMATPRDLADFAIGFSLTEGVVASPDAIEALEIVEEDIGVEVRMRLAEPFASAFLDRRRYLAGPTGCGLCGIESLGEAMRPVATVTAKGSYAAADILAAVAGLQELQEINRTTHAVHGAGFYRRSEGIVALREDVGRHNALDKLAGGLAQAGVDGASGLAVLTSRLSIELVQKAARMATPLLVGVSAPTALAVRAAQACGMTLVGIARGDGFEIFTHPERIREEQRADVLA